MASPHISFTDRYSSTLQPLLLLATDYLAIILAEFFAVSCRELVLTLLDRPLNAFELNDFYFYLFIPLIFLVFLHWGRTYIRLMSIGEMIRRTFYSVVYSIVVSIVVLFVAGKAPVVSRLFIAFLGCFVFIFVCGARLTIRVICNRAGILLEPTILIGSDETAKKVLDYSSNNSFFGIKVIGLIDDKPSGKALEGKYPWLGPTKDATKILLKTQVQNVLVLAPRMNKPRLYSLIDEIFPLVKNISFVPDIEELPVSNMEMHRLYSENMVVISVKNNLSRWYNQAIKRSFDLIVASLGIVAISPILLTIAAAIKLSGPGPVVYTHRRIGKDGRHFNCYKFRSMVQDSDQKLKEYLAANPEAATEWKESHKLKHDPRVTKIGAWLRKTSLDELPQLMNVILGQMSLVGPRPIVDDEIIKYDVFFSDYSMVRPGMTGLWQTSGRSDTSYERRVRMDAWYVRNWNIWLDISLLVKTVRVVFSSRSGAY